MSSSIHIQAGHAGSVTHNSRETPTKNSIFSDESNECSLSSKEAFKMYRDELQLRTIAYTQNTGQKLQSKAITHLSAVVNLEKHHTLKDLEALKQHLEDTLDTVVFQVAIHRDEGHVNEELKDVKNYHAHIEFMGLDSQGSSVRKKLTKKYLSDLQTETAKILGMERGKNYAAEKAPRPKRLDTHQYKDYKKRESKEIKSKVVTIAELKDTIKSLRAELKENKATRADYAELEKVHKELKDKITAKDLSIEMFKQRIKILEAGIARCLKPAQKQELAKEKDSIAQAAQAAQMLKSNFVEFKNENDKFKTEIAHNQSETAQKLTEKEKTIQTLVKQKADVVAQNLAFKEQIARSNQTISVKIKAIETDERTKKSFLSHFKAPENTDFWGFFKQKVSKWLEEIRELKAENSKLKEENQIITDSLNGQLAYGKEKNKKIEELKKIVDYPGVADFYRDKVFQQISKNQSNHRQLER